MEREAPFFQGLVHAEALWNDFGSQSFLKVPNAPLASLARSLRSPCGFSLGFRWGFAGVSLAILDRKPPKRSANLPQNPWKIELNTPQNPPQNPPESTPKPEKVEVWRGLRFRLLFVTFCAPPGGVLGPSWGVLGASWGRLGAALGRLGGVLGRLGTVLGCLGAVLGVLGPSWGLAAVLKAIFDQI